MTRDQEMVMRKCLADATTENADMQLKYATDAKKKTEKELAQANSVIKDLNTKVSNLKDQNKYVVSGLNTLIKAREDENKLNLIKEKNAAADKRREFSERKRTQKHIQKIQDAYNSVMRQQQTYLMCAIKCDETKALKALMHIEGPTGKSHQSKIKKLRKDVKKAKDKLKNCSKKTDPKKYRKYRQRLEKAEGLLRDEMKDARKGQSHRVVPAKQKVKEIDSDDSEDEEQVKQKPPKKSKKQKSKSDKSSE